MSIGVALSVFSAVSQAIEKPKTGNNDGLLLHCFEVQPRLWSKEEKGDSV